MNSMLLLGLAVAIGILIDDTIVVRENLVRHLELGEDTRGAARRATAELRGPLTTATFALIPGFLAIALVGGLLKPFAIIAAGAILVSSVLALTLVPRTVVGVRGQGSGVWLDRITDRYHDALAWGLDHRGLVGTLVLATLLVPGLLAGGRSRETGERAGVVLAIQGPDATTLRGVTRRVADQLRLLPGAAGMVLITRSGTAGPPAGDPVVTIQLRFAGRAPQPAELRASLDSVPLPPGYRILRSGISATGPGLWLAVGAAVLVLYLVLVLRFGSFRDPLGILAALALAPLGGVAALLLTRNGLSLSGVVGLLLVLGLALRHSTLLLTCARRRHAKGASLRVALIDAARLRLRPVLLSTVTLALASVPLALLGGATLGPFASAALGGLLTTLPTTLLVTPVGYEVLARRQGGQPALDLG